MRPLALAVMLVLLAACAAPGAGSPTPMPPEEAATAQAPATPTPFTEAESATATALAAAIATPTSPSPADIATATAMSGGGVVIPATFTPVAGAVPVLPAPIYVRSLVLGQVLRIERDIITYRQLTFERRPVLELAAPAAGGLFYLFGEPEGRRTLVSLSGTGRRELFSGELSDLTVTPDGTRAFVRIDAPEPGLISGQDTSPAGVWAVAADGGRPALVLADVPADGVYDDAAPAWTYLPLAVSPDGNALAVFAFDQDGPGIPGGELVIVDLAGTREPVRGPTCCEAPVWSADSRSLLVAGGGPAPDTRYGLYRIDAATAAETPLLTSEQSTSIPLITAPYATAAGDVYAFAELAPAEGFGWEYPFRPVLARVERDGAITPRSEALPLPEEVLWADEGRGALISAPGSNQSNPDPMIWQAADGSPSVNVPFEGLDLAWVPANGPLAAGDCAAFNPLRYQASGARREDTAVADLQARLPMLGFDGGLPDGFYGEQTRAGVMAFQRAQGLDPSGDVDCATWQALLAQP